MIINTHKKSSLYLVLCLRGGMHIFVKTLIGKTITLEVEISDTMNKSRPKFKARMEFLEIIKDCSLLGKQCEDDRTLADYDI